MKSRLFLMYAVLLLSGLLQAQEKERSISLELNTGIELGWWIWDKGSTVEGLQNNLGWGRSHLSGMAPVGATVFYHHGKGLIGAGFRRSWLFDKELIDSEEKRGIKRYDVAENTVKFWRFGLYGGYKLVRMKRFTFYPKAGLGWFEMGTSFEGKDRFGARIWWSMALENVVQLGNWGLIFSAEYVNMAIAGKDRPGIYHESHRIYAVGVNIGLRYNIPL